MAQTEPNLFRKWREAAKLTQFEAAVSLGVTPAAVSGWENGQTPAMKQADKISEVYSVPLPTVLEAMRASAMAASSAVG